MALEPVDVEGGHEQIVDPLEQIRGEEPGGFWIVTDQALHHGGTVGMPEHGEGCVPVLSSSVPYERQCGRFVLDLEIFEIGLLVFEELVLHAGILQQGEQAEPGRSFVGWQVEMLARMRQELLVLVEYCAVRVHEEDPEPVFDDGQCDLPTADWPLDELHDE